eukprot:8705629-Karenia_brevis.AAC.1
MAKCEDVVDELDNPDSELSQLCSPELVRQLKRKLGCVGSKMLKPPPKNASKARAVSKDSPRKLTPKQPD